MGPYKGLAIADGRGGWTGDARRRFRDSILEERQAEAFRERTEVVFAGEECGWKRADKQA
jgi:hypothetical protein